MLILICDAFSPDLPARLAPFGEVSDDPARLAEADVALIRSKTKASADWIDAAANLKLIIRGGVGLDNVDQAHARRRGVAVHNTAEASSIAVAELALAMLLAMPNHLIRAHGSMREGAWLKKELKRSELHGKTLGLLGAGHIGSEVARRALAFGMTVIAHDPFLDRHPLAELVPSLPDFLGRCDYISIHTPLTAQTEGMLDAAAFARMKDGVYLVNTARAKVVVEADMRAALESGKVAGYATDVWASDPPEDSPLRDAPNMLMTPHFGASTAENMGRIGDVIVSLLGDFVRVEA
ncbi:MAG: hydroxyacid dehydrogenase [Caldilineae bacterium]|nr:hydroxyacid dehydrogenase [Chloroflexota bacterium]MCB9176581.1 hydroxyacid dehydrogenase [Caldilineae bacterium]